MDVALMTLAAALGFANGPLMSIILIAIVLTGLSHAKYTAIASRYADVGHRRVAALSIGATALNNLVFTSLTFAAGRAFAWLVSL